MSQIRNEAKITLMIDRKNFLSLFKLYLKVELAEDAVSDLQGLERKNQELREGIIKIQQQYPRLQASLRRVVSGLVKIEV